MIAKNFSFCTKAKETCTKNPEICTKLCCFCTNFRIDFQTKNTPPNYFCFCFSRYSVGVMPKRCLKHLLK